MKNILIAALLIVTSSLSYAQTDKDIDNDGQWYYGHADTDRYLDSGSQWNSGGSATAGESGNDGQWNSSSEGTDKNLGYDGQWGSSRAAPIKFSIMAVSGIPTMMVKIGI